jgi:site-specific recombinase XerD
MVLSEWITAYLAFQSARGESLSTRRHYATEIRAFGRWWQARYGAEPTLLAFTEPLLFAYLQCEEERGLRPRSRMMKVAAMRAFGKWLVAFGHLRVNPAARIPLPRLDDPQRELMGEQEAAALISACDRFPNPVRGKLARAVLLTFLTTGIRRSELLNLNREDVNLTERTLLVQHGKGGRTRRIPLHPTTIQAIADWLSVRNPDAPTPRLFLRGRSFSMSSFALSSLLKDVQAIAGMRGKTNLNPHSQRYFFTDQLVEQREDIKTIQELLGHKSVTTTWGYMRTNEARKRRAIETMHIPGENAQTPSLSPLQPDPPAAGSSETSRPPYQMSLFLNTKRRRISLR